MSSANVYDRDADPDDEQLPVTYEFGQRTTFIGVMIAWETQVSFRTSRLVDLRRSQQEMAGPTTEV